MRKAVLAAVVIVTSLGYVVTSRIADAAKTPSGVEYHAMQFPVLETVSFFDDFGGPRNHPGNDLIGQRLFHELAANDGTITFARSEPARNSGNMLILTGTDGWKYWYLHINNDSPGTDDGKNPAQWRFAPGIQQGSHVKRGQFIAYMGDSGEAEPTVPHLHFELHRPDDSFIDPYTSLRLAQHAGANGLCTYPTAPTPHPNPAAGRGFWTIGSDGTVLAFGSVHAYGSPPRPGAFNAWVAIEPTPSGNGYWTVDALGNVRTFGDAHFYGSMGGHHLNAPMIAMSPTPSGHGYWLMARDGGIFTFGDAHFYGSTGGHRLNAPIISLASTTGGHGYWLLGADGGIFTFGDARFWGSTGGHHLNAPVLSMAATTNGYGYWLLASDGGIFTFGNAHFVGSMPGLGWCPGPAAIAIARTKTNGGYWIMVDDGRVLTFGDAQPYGQPASSGRRAVSLAAAR